LIKKDNYDRYYLTNLIEWWKNKAQNRFQKLKDESKNRTELEIYTPETIVKYICKETIEPFIKGKKPDEISKLKIVDPACGSGSFLLGAYSFLLDYHLDYYTELKRNGKKVPQLNVAGKLTNEVKKKILINNIYGVDLDSNAVEVAKLSLLLKCMEEETKGTIDHQLKFFHERVLPTLDNNIKCGNSLVDNDYYDSELDFGDEKTANPFNWKREFSEIFKQGGFDIVIGNPPYVLLEGEFRNDDMISYFRKKYKCASYKLDLYHLFIEKGIYLLKDSGKLGYITPSNFLSNNGLVSLRETILNNSYINILNVITGKVFTGASVDTTISILSRDANKKKSIFIHSDWKGKSMLETKKVIFDQNNFNENEGKIFIATGKNIKFKVYNSIVENNAKSGMGVIERMAMSHNDCRKYALHNKYDFLLHLESDVFPPKDVIQELLFTKKKFVNALYYSDEGKYRRPMIQMHLDVAPNYGSSLWLNTINEPQFITGETIRVALAGLGCALISCDILKKIEFRYEKGVDKHPDTFFAEDCERFNIPIFLNTSVVCEHRNQNWGIYGIDYK
jgi:hypothetical protein